MTIDEVAEYWAAEPPVDAETWARIATDPALRGYVTPDALINGRTIEFFPHLIAQFELAAWRDQQRVQAENDRIARGRCSPLYLYLGQLRGEFLRLQRAQQQEAA